MDQRSKCKARHYKTLKENIDRTPLGINCSYIFFDPLPKVMKIKNKNKLELIKLKSS